MDRRLDRALTHPLWWDQLDEPVDGAGRPRRIRASLHQDHQCDVAIVGAGFTGLWTALELHRRDPSLRIVVLERDVAGSGASGRNGGWCSGLLPMGLAAVAERHGADRARRAAAVTAASVAEVGRRAHELGIDCGFRHDGWIEVATNAAQVARAHDRLAEDAAFGAGRLRWLERAEAATVVDAPGVLGAVFDPDCAALQPARLVRGLAQAAEQRGVSIHEHSPIVAIEPGRVVARHGSVRAGVVVRATEAGTTTLRGHRRTIAPLHSLVIATEPLADEVWSAIGWPTACTFNDGRHVLIYAQRTVDGRLVLGGRGAAYGFASATGRRFEIDDRVHGALAATMTELFPATAGATITHRWGGALALSRDWWCSMGLDRSNGVAWAGGYAGDGVAMANLAGRTLADLICGINSELTEQPWVGRTPRRWPVEPLRWAGANLGLVLAGAIDRAEAEGRRARAGSAVLAALTGR